MLITNFQKYNDGGNDDDDNNNDTVPIGDIPLATHYKYLKDHYLTV